MAVAFITAVKAPFIWDCDYWLLLTDLALLLAFLQGGLSSLASEPTPAERATIYARAASLIRCQMGIFYLAAGIAPARPSTNRAPTAHRRFPPPWSSARAI